LELTFCMNTLLKTYLSKINFILGRNPQVEKSDGFQQMIPEPYQSVFTISADFELAWAWRYSKALENPVEAALMKARRARKNTPVILELCEKYNIPITWATVGHLFLEECHQENGKIHHQLPRLAHFENDYWQFENGDWFQHDPGANYKTAPEWYAPDLINEILKSPVDHEIACHTFSHIDCRDHICPGEVFKAELNACKDAARSVGVELKTLIYPAHTVGNLDALTELGFTNYRSNDANTLGYPVLRNDGLWEIKSTMELKFRDDWSIDYHIYRTKKVIERAINHNASCHFWFHPSFSERYLNQVMPEVFQYLDSQRDEIWITSMKDYVNWLNTTSG